MKMAPIPSVEMKVNFQECYRSIQELMEYLPKLNIMDENDPEYKVMYVKYHETLQKFMENQPMLPEMPSDNKRTNKCCKDGCIIEIDGNRKCCAEHRCKCIFLGTTDTCPNLQRNGDKYCDEHMCSVDNCHSPTYTSCNYCDKHRCKHGFITGECQSKCLDGQKYCEEHTCSYDKCKNLIKGYGTNKQDYCEEHIKISEKSIDDFCSSS